MAELSETEKVLAEHWFVVHNVRPGSRWVGCDCGWQQPSDDHNGERHNAHLASILDAHWAERVEAVLAKWDEHYENQDVPNDYQLPPYEVLLNCTKAIRAALARPADRTTEGDL